jgi:hypothetical protein
MATITKALARGSFGTSLADLYTVPTTGTTSIVTNIVVTNSSSGSATFYLLLDGVELFANTQLEPYGTLTVDIKQVLDANSTPKKIKGYANSTNVRYHISGVEIS